MGTKADLTFPHIACTCAGIEELREKREEINKQINKEEDEKAKVQNDLTVLSKRLTTLNESIARKVRQITVHDLKDRVSMRRVS